MPRFEPMSAESEILKRSLVQDILLLKMKYFHSDAGMCLVSLKLENDEAICFDRKLEARSSFIPSYVFWKIEISLASSLETIQFHDDRASISHFEVESRQRESERERETERECQRECQQKSEKERR